MFDFYGISLFARLLSGSLLGALIQGTHLKVGPTVDPNG